MLMSKQDFLYHSTKTLSELFDLVNTLPALDLRELNAESTVLIIVDMVNGFAREGMLQSPRVETIIAEIVNIAEACDAAKIAKLAFGDCHTENAAEFASYPPHCLKNSTEAEMVSELKAVGGYRFFAKNSTNGFLENEFQNWLKDNKQIDTFIITGDCTDICVQQLAVTLKAWFNTHNKPSRIIVPANAVETYDLGVHNAELMNVISLYTMLSNGVEVIQKIK